MNNESGPFVLITHWGTILCVEKHSGKLEHRQLADCESEILFVTQKNETTIFSLLCSSAIDAFNFRELNIKAGPSGDTFSVSRNGLFASAEPSGRIAFDRQAASSWETFSAASLGEIVKRKSMKFPRFRAGCSIPRIIHQTFPNENLPSPLRQNVIDLRSRNPDYAYKLWTDKDVEDFIYEVYGYDLLQIFRKIDPSYGACRADLFRYLCIFKYGGVYLDIKSNCTVPLSNIVRPDDSFIVSQWDRGKPNRAQFGQHAELRGIDGGEYQQWHIISRSGHPLMEKVIALVLDNIMSYSVKRHGVGKLGALRVTGPIAYSLAIQSRIAVSEHRSVPVEQQGMVYEAIPNYLQHFASHYTKQDRPVILSR